MPASHREIPEQEARGGNVIYHVTNSRVVHAPMYQPVIIALWNGRLLLLLNWRFIYNVEIGLSLLGACQCAKQMPDTRRARSSFFCMQILKVHSDMLYSLKRAFCVHVPREHPANTRVNLQLGRLSSFRQALCTRHEDMRDSLLTSVFRQIYRLNEVSRWHTLMTM